MKKKNSKVGTVEGCNVCNNIKEYSNDNIKLISEPTTRKLPLYKCLECNSYFEVGMDGARFMSEEMADAVYGIKKGKKRVRFLISLALIIIVLFSALYTGELFVLYGFAIAAATAFYEK